MMDLDVKQRLCLQFFILLIYFILIHIILHFLSLSLRGDGVLDLIGLDPDRVLLDTRNLLSFPQYMQILILLGLLRLFIIKHLLSSLVLIVYRSIGFLLCNFNVVVVVFDVFTVLV